MLDELSTKNIAEGTLILTDNQINGRGQMGNVWQSDANNNLTFSILLSPKWLKPVQQFYITKLVSIALINVLNELKTGFEIKWPNDIYFENKKVAGVLIENFIQYDKINQSVIGIGLNVNQEKFENAKANSLKNIIGADVDKNILLKNICEGLEANYLRFKNDCKIFDRLYLENLYRRGEIHWFESDNEKFKAEIIGVNSIGKLKIKTENGLKEFGMKKIRFL